MKKGFVIAFDKAIILARTSKSYFLRLENAARTAQVSKVSFHMFVVYPHNLVDEYGFLLPGRTIDVVITDQGRIYPNRSEYPKTQWNPQDYIL